MVFGSAASGDSVSFGIRAVADLKGVDATAKALTDLGKKGETAGKGIDKGMDEAAKSLDKTRISAAALGAAIGTTVGIVSKLGQAHKSEESQIRAVERAYGDQADAVFALAGELQGLGIATDDAVRISALGAQSLAKNYGLTADQIEQLIRRSADLAAVTFDQYGNQLQLADVMQRVAGAIRGEGEAAEVLGLAMSDSALASRAAAEGLEGWTTTMTESEKAAFRFKVLMEDSADAQGAAAERADGLAGKVTALKFAIGDAASTFGGLLGPVGESAAVLGDFALALPLIGAGAGKAVSALSSLKTAAQGSAIAMGAMTLATGPVGLVLAAGAAAGAIYLLTQRETDNERITRQLTEATDSFTASIVASTTALAQRGLLDETDALRLYLDTWVTNGLAAQDRIDELNQAIDDLKLRASTGAESDFFFIGDEVIQGLDNWTKEWLNANGAMADGIITIQELQAVLPQLSAGFELTGEQATALTTAMDAVAVAMANPQLNGQAIADEASAVFEQMLSGAISVEEAIQRLNALPVSREFNIAAQETAESAAQSTEAIEANIRALNDWINTQAGWAGRGRQMALDAAELALSFDAWTESLEGVQEHTVIYGDVADALAAVTLEEEEHRRAVESSAQAVQDATREADLYADEAAAMAAEIEAAAQSFVALYDTVTGGSLVLEGLAVSSATFADNIGLAFSNAAGTLDTVQRIALGNLDAVRATTTSIVDQVEEIVNLEGTYESINVALDRGLISQERWASYGRAFIRMERDRVKLNEDLAVIQANQIPILEQALNTQTAWADQVKDLKGLDLAAALGFADAETAGKALEIQSYAIAAAQGELGVKGTETAEALIAGAIQANPYLLGVLEAMEVINVMPDGTWTLNTEGLEEAKSGTQLLTEAINNLVGAYELILNVDVDDDGQIGPLIELDGKQINTTVSVNTVHTGSPDGIGFINDGTDSAPAASDPVFKQPDPIVIVVNSEQAATARERVKQITRALGDLADQSVTLTLGSEPAATARDRVKSVTRAMNDLDDVGFQLGIDDQPAIDAKASIDAASKALANLDGESATVHVYANTSPFWSSIGAIPDSLGTRYIDVVTRQLGGNGTPSAAYAMADTRPQTIMQQSYAASQAGPATSGPITVTANFGDINEASDIPRVQAAILTTLERAADRVYAATVAGG